MRDKKRGHRPRKVEASINQSSIGKWVPHELNNSQMERRRSTCEVLLAIGLYDRRILNVRNSGWILANHQHLQDQIASDGRWCCAFDGISWISSSMSYWNLVALLIPTIFLPAITSWKKAGISAMTWHFWFPKLISLFLITN